MISRNCGFEHVVLEHTDMHMDKDIVKSNGAREWCVEYFILGGTRKSEVIICDFKY